MPSNDVENDTSDFYEKPTFMGIFDIPIKDDTASNDVHSEGLRDRISKALMQSWFSQLHTGGVTEDNPPTTVVSVKEKQIDALIEVFIDEWIDDLQKQRAWYDYSPRSIAEAKGYLDRKIKSLSDRIQSLNEGKAE